MSALGAEQQDIRSIVQPLLDAIAPDCITNNLERAANPEIPAIGWQNDFFEKKIRQPLSLEVLELNGAWEDDTPDAQKLDDILKYLKIRKGSASPDFIECITSLLDHAQEYIRGIHVLVQSKFDDPKQLDCFEPKALVAFARMVNIVLSFNALQLKPNQEARRLLEETIAQLSSFSARERILFRFHKAADTTLSFDAFRRTDNSGLLGGKTYDNEYERTLFALKNLSMHPASPGQATQGFLQGSLGVIKNAVLFPFVKMQQLSQYVNQSSAFPFRAAKATTQDIPIVGKMVGFSAETLNTVKDYALPAAEAGLLAWMSMFEFCKMIGLSPDQLDSNPVTDFIGEASPYLKAGLGLYSVLAGIYCTAQIAYIGASSVGATYRGLTTGKDLMQAIIDENQAIFRDDVLTEENLAQNGWQILNTPIIVPQDLKAILSEEDQNEIIRQVAWGRLDLVKDLFPAFQDSAVHVVRDRERGIATPVYLPSQGQGQQPVPAVQAQMLADLRLDEDALEELAQNPQGRRITFDT